MAANISDATSYLASLVGHLSHRVRMIAPDQTRRELRRTPIACTRLNRSNKIQGPRLLRPGPTRSGRRSSPYRPPHEIPHAYLFRSHAYSQPALRRAQIVMGARGALERLALEADRGGELVQLPHGLVADHVAPLARPMPPDWVRQDQLSSSCGLWIRPRDPLRRAVAFRDGPLSHRTGAMQDSAAKFRDFMVHALG